MVNEPNRDDAAERPIVRTTTEARQGDRSVLSLRVLAMSLILVVALFAAIYFIFYGTQP